MGPVKQSPSQTIEGVDGYSDRHSPRGPELEEISCTSWESLQGEIRGRFGVLPNFFGLTPESPETTANLWGFARFAYLDNPLPSLFKERLFVYLSRFCDVRYCITRHVGFLIGLGRPSGDAHARIQSVPEVIRLLRRPLPRGQALEPLVARCSRLERPLTVLPEPDAEMERAIFACASHAFLQTHEAPHCLDALRHALGDPRFHQLLTFLAFVRTAHYWSKIHSDLAIEDDLVALLAAHEELAQCLLDDSEAEAGDLGGRMHAELGALRRSASDHAAELNAQKREGEVHFHSVLGAAPIAVFVCDRSAVLQYCNPRAVELWGREPKLEVERHCGSQRLWLPNGTELAHEDSPIVEALHTGEAIRGVELWIERPDGSRVPVSVDFAALKNEEGVITGAVACFQDISERKRYEAALEEADRRKNEFLATLSHELRNPLAPIRNAVSLLDPNLEPATFNQVRGILDRQVGQMVRLIDDLLDLSRISQGKLTLRPERVELAAVLERVLETWRPAADAAGHELSVSLPPEPVWLDADALRLGQVFGNLLHNAFKFTEPPGRIRLGAESSAGDLTVSVRDSGMGISPDAIENIFDMFEQADRSLERSQGGLGIGLTLVKRLVELHGGTISAHSEGVGRGSEFMVRLPLPPLSDHDDHCAAFPADTGRD